MIFGFELRFSINSCKTLIIDRYAQMDSGFAFTHVISFDNESRDTREVISDMAGIDFAVEAPGVVTIGVMLDEEVSEFAIVRPYENKRDYFWRQRRKRIRLEREGEHLREEIHDLKTQMSRMCSLCLCKAGGV